MLFFKEAILTAVTARGILEQLRRKAYWLRD